MGKYECIIKEYWKKNEKDWSIVFYVWIMEFKIIDFRNGIFVGEDCGKYVDFE